MEPHDEQTHSVLNQVDAFRTNWISINEKLREANAKIESLEAELSTLKNQLYYSVCEKEILNHTLEELRKTLRADCKVIDQIQRNKSSFIRLAHEYDEETTVPRNSNILASGSEARAMITSSENRDQDIPSFVNNSISQSDKTRPKPNKVKKIELPSLNPTQKKTSLPNLSDVSTRSQNGRSASEILLEKTSRANLNIASRKMMELRSKIFSRGRNKILEDPNARVSEVIVIDCDDEAEDSPKSVRPANDIFISSENVYVEEDDSDSSSTSSSSGSKNADLENEVDRNESSNNREDFEPRTDLFRTIRPENNEEIGINSNVQKVITSNLYEQAGSIPGTPLENGYNSQNQDVQSSVGLNSNKPVNHIRPATLHKQDELDFSISDAIKSVPDNPIVLLSPLDSSKKIPSNENNKRRKRKSSEVVNPEEYDLKSLVLIKKFHSPSPLVPELHSQITSSSPSSRKIPSKVSKKIPKKSVVQKKKNFPPRTFVCKICNDKFNCPTALSRHLNSVHVGDGRTWNCPTCGFITQSKSSFASHISQHKIKEKCVICEKENPQDIQQYLKKSDLDLHILEKHPNPYPDYIPCPHKNGECNKYFSTTKAYDKHVNAIHKDEDLSLPKEKIFPGQDFWTCSACGKIFTQAWHLSKHADRDHTRNQKVFSCEFCDFRTSQLKTLRKHFEVFCFEKNKQN